MLVSLSPRAEADGNGSPDACLETTTGVVGSIDGSADLITYNAGVGLIVDGVCIKSGAGTFDGRTHSGVLGNGTFDSGCYQVTGVGAQVVTVTRLNDSCQGLSHIDVVVRVPATSTPTATQPVATATQPVATATQQVVATSTPTNTPEATNTPTNTPGATSTPTNTPEATNTPTNTPEATSTPTNTPSPTETVETVIVEIPQPPAAIVEVEVTAQPPAAPVEQVLGVQQVITPPNTGDAGLADSEHSRSFITQLLMLAGVAGLVTALSVARLRHLKRR